MADTATVNLDLLYMAVGAPNREIVVNDGLAVLDSTVAGVLALDLAGVGDYVLTDGITGEAKYGVLRLTGVLTGARRLVVPDRGRQYLVENQTTGAFALTITTATGAGVTLDQDSWGLLVCDGTDVFATVTGGAGGAGGTPPAATETQAGVIELATSAEVLTGTDAVRAVTPAGLAARTATETRLGLIEVATTAETTTGTDDTRALTPLKLQQRLTAVLPVPASETVAGVVELATQAEVNSGTDSTRAVTPQTLQGKLTTAQTGTPLSVTRYNAAGTALEASPGVTVDTAGRLGIGTMTPTTGTHQQGETSNMAVATLTAYVSVANAPIAVYQHAYGTVAAPEIVAATARNINLSGQVWARNAGDTATGFQSNTAIVGSVESVDAQGRVGGRLDLYTGPPVSGALVVRLRITQDGNLLTGGLAQAGTSLARGLALASGTAPTAAHPADAVQMWVSDRASVAGKASLHVRTEDGTSHVLGDQVGLGTLCDGTLGSGATYQALTVKGSHLLVGQSSVQERPMALVQPSWLVQTDATRTTRLVFAAYDANAAREGLRIEADGTAPRLGVLGAAAQPRQAVPAAATDAATTQALTNSLRQALLNFGFVI